MSVKIDFDYDDDMDILYLSKGKPKAGYAVKLAPDIFLRKDLINDQIIGADICDVSTHDFDDVANLLPFTVTPVEVSAIKKALPNN